MTQAQTKLIFLGGTCGYSEWREKFTADLLAAGFTEDQVFNPVVLDWTPECQAKEDAAKKDAWMSVFFITDPEQAGNPVPTYSICEAIMGLYDRPDTTCVVFDLPAFTGQFLKALQKTYADLHARFPELPIFKSGQEAVAYMAAE